MIRLSAIIITFNEERNIGRCLASLSGVADEIVVVDSYSTDRTEAICLEYGAKFIRHAFEGHIEQKNYALDQAAFPYILSLDADEALSPELRQSVLDAKSNWKADGYYVSRITSYCGKWIRHGGWYPDRKLRMARRASVSWGGENPHDRLILNEGAVATRLSGDLLHYSYYSIAGHIGQVNKFTDIGSKSAYRSGRRFSFFSLLVKPPYKFLRDYILRGGFLDGYYGFVIAAISAHATFLKYVKLRELEKNEKQNGSK